MFVKRVIVGAVAAAAITLSGLAGGIASAAEDVNIGVGELQECTISKSMDTADEDVDGRDFLAWQRGSSAPNQSVGGNLADWQTNYGIGY
jgi:hypothetical protein